MTLAGMVYDAPDRPGAPPGPSHPNASPGPVVAVRVAVSRTPSDVRSANADHRTRRLRRGPGRGRRRRGVDDTRAGPSPLGRGDGGARRGTARRDRVVPGAVDDRAGEGGG